MFGYRASDFAYVTTQEHQVEVNGGRIAQINDHVFTESVGLITFFASNYVLGIVLWNIFGALIMLMYLKINVSIYVNNHYMIYNIIYFTCSRWLLS